MMKLNTMKHVNDVVFAKRNFIIIKMTKDTKNVIK